jgi:hypothetical protein
MRHIASITLLVLASCDAFIPRVLSLHKSAASHSVPEVRGQPIYRGLGGLLATDADGDGENEASALIGRCALCSQFRLK